ncbi:uncharacterized protein LDX57_002665 [Aspergillus melleus]|uniref:uncharacterized protein n=1 Tax=Aspergillus melleus TaxID=138277 RepID=UPI001E8D9505|nr:uncharacterized protein LDX57_002665 [Aspergillus melleus]KAH8424919.1 hypothetical protein LDX57_002665 [Aspergillus melleus]
MQCPLLRLLALAPFLRYLELVAAARPPAPYVMTWSDKSYGPDGPWQAVSVGIGSASQKIALYPGGTWESRILVKSLCANTSLSSVCYADDAGLFNTEESNTWDNTSINIPPKADTWSDFELGAADAVPVKARVERAMDTIDLGGDSVYDVDLLAVSQAYQTYPGGQNYPLEVGVLSLGCPEFNQTFTRGDGVSINATFINSHVFTAKMASSYSFGMHIGSAPLRIPGSLMLGGYDGNRIVGETSAQPYSGGKFPIKLLDVGIGVASGGSPWNYFNKTGLLEKGNSSLHQGITVMASPGDPYLYLPKSSCDAITSELPTTYDSDLGLYLWNTSDPRYEQIIKSPSYLSFEFNKNSLNSANITIKVPFALLNLTLEAPLVKNPTLYFPCMGTDGTPALGRAFLQAAFMAANWSWGGRIGNWILAQAPGPNYFTTNKLTNIMEKDMTIPGTTNNWEETWANYWTPIPITSSSATPVPTPSSKSDDSNDNGISTGAVVGIAVGCAAAGVLLGVLAWVFITRRRRRNALEQGQMAHVYPGIRVKHAEGVYELNGRRGPYELAIRHPPYELAGPDH